MVRRAIDVIVAAVALILLSPLMLCTMVGIAVFMGRPMLFFQPRSGLNGRRFVICKMRTMRVPDYPGQPDHERLTWLGKFLRASSFDELPQLWNVLCGHMSLIGPRPTLPEQVARYGPHERRRLEVRPGLTGYAQVKVRNSASWQERIELDIWYIEHRSLALDLRIVAWTVLRLLRPHGITGEGGVNPTFPGPAPAEAEGRSTRAR